MKFLNSYYIGYGESFDRYEAETEQAYVELHDLEDEAIESIMLNHQVLAKQEKEAEINEQLALILRYKNLNH